MNIIKEIQATPTYKSLQPIQRDVCITKTNRVQLTQALAIASTIGFVPWSKMSSYSERNKAIVKDIMTARHTTIGVDLVDPEWIQGPVGALTAFQNSYRSTANN